MKEENKKVIFLRSTSIINDSRVTKEAESLQKNGFDVMILGWDRDGFLGNDTKLELKEYKIPIKVFKRRAKYGAGIKSIFKLLEFQIWLLYNLLKNRKNIDIIHACDLDTALPARFIAKFYKKRMVYDIFDYYIDSHYVPNKVKKIVEKTEINIINNADLTIICTAERKKQIKKAKPKKCIVIYNTPNISENKLNTKVIKSLNNKLKIGYVGILQENRMLKEIGEEIKECPEIELHIGGFGDLQSYFLNASKEYDNIFYYGSMKYEDVISLERDCDILFATYNPNVQNHRYSAPNKLYEAMALGKPIIVCENTGVDKFVNNNKIGYSIPYNVKEFIKYIKYIERDREIKSNLGNYGKDLYDKKYSWKKMIDILIKEYKLL